MRDYDYIVTVDRDGRPVICHAGIFGGNKGGTQKGSQRENHKYLARIADKGKYLYFYTKQELENYYRGGRKKVEDATGITARKNLENANIFNRKKRQEAYDNTALGRAEKTARGALDKASSATAGLRTKARGAVGNAKDRLGFDEREDLENANIFNRKKRQEAYDNTALGKAENAVKGLREKSGEFGSNLKSKTERMREELRKGAGIVSDKARGAVDNTKDRLGFDEREDLENANIFNRKKRQEAYDNTALGKAENAVRDAREKVGELDDRVRDAAGSAREAVGNLASRAEKLRDDIRKNIEDIADDVREQAGNVTGSNQKKAASQAQQAALMGLDGAIGDFVDAQNAYDNSLGGRASNTGKKAQETLENAQKAAQDALKQAKEFLSPDQFKELTSFLRKK